MAKERKWKGYGLSGLAESVFLKNIPSKKY